MGYVGGGFIEMAAQDPEQGMSFYILQQEPMDKPFLLKQDRCLQCHLSRNSMDIPGMVAATIAITTDRTNRSGLYVIRAGIRIAAIPV